VITIHNDTLTYGTAVVLQDEEFTKFNSESKRRAIEQSETSRSRTVQYEVTLFVRPRNVCSFILKLRDLV
jgi:hypothetical protein